MNQPEKQAMKEIHDFLGEKRLITWKDVQRKTQEIFQAKGINLDSIPPKESWKSWEELRKLPKDLAVQRILDKEPFFKDKFTALRVSGNSLSCFFNCLSLLIFGEQNKDIIRLLIFAKLVERGQTVGEEIEREILRDVVSASANGDVQHWASLAIFLHENDFSLFLTYYSERVEFITCPTEYYLNLKPHECWKLANNFWMFLHSGGIGHFTFLVPNSDKVSLVRSLYKWWIINKTDYYPFEPGELDSWLRKIDSTDEVEKMREILRIIPGDGWNDLVGILPGKDGQKQKQEAIRIFRENRGNREKIIQEAWKSRLRTKFAEILVELRAKTQGEINLSTLLKLKKEKMQEIVDFLKELRSKEGVINSFFSEEEKKIKEKLEANEEQLKKQIKKIMEEKKKSSKKKNKFNFILIDDEDSGNSFANSSDDSGSSNDKDRRTGNSSVPSFSSSDSLNSSNSESSSPNSHYSVINSSSLSISDNPPLETKDWQPQSDSWITKNSGLSVTKAKSEEKSQKNSFDQQQTRITQEVKQTPKESVNIPVQIQKLKEFEKNYSRQNEKSAKSSEIYSKAINSPSSSSSKSSQISIWASLSFLILLGIFASYWLIPKFFPRKK